VYLTLLLEIAGPLEDSNDCIDIDSHDVETLSAVGFCSVI